jgi:MFS superfamily sulfate permease-like transporter
MTAPQEEKPAWPIFRSLRSMGHGAWRYDLIAGLTLAAIAIPEQMATARLGGFSPQIGFFAFIAGSLAFAAFGSSRYLSSGADSTIAPIFAGSLTTIAATGSPHYAELAAILSLMVGAILIGAGLFRAGWIADLLSVPVTTGFLAGIAIHIVVSQAPSVLGLPVAHGDMLHRIGVIAQELSRTNFGAVAVATSCLGVIMIGEIISSRIPGALIALAGATLAVQYFKLDEKGVAVLGPIPKTLPHPSFSEVAVSDLSQTLGLAVVVAVVVMVQTAATSRSFPDYEGADPDVDRDFLGVGAGSALAGLLGAFPVDASPPRTAIVAETGGKTQLSGLFAAAVIGGVALYGGDLLSNVPHAALAGVLLFIAGRIFRVATMVEIWRDTRAEFMLVVVTLLAVILLPIEIGVALSILLSLAHGMWTTTRTRLLAFERVPGTSIWWPKSDVSKGERLEGVLVVAFQAPLSFLNAYQFHHDFLRALEKADAGLKLAVLEAGGIVEIDFTAARILRQVIERSREMGVDFAIARLESVRAQQSLTRFGVIAALGEGRIFHSVDEATRALAPEAKARIKL